MKFTKKTLRSLFFLFLHFWIPITAISQVTIRGSVFDIVSKAPVKNAVISLKSGEQVNTDEWGFFAIDAQQAEALLTIEATGYFPQSVKTSNENSQVLYLRRDPRQVTETLLYGKLKNKLTTESISSVSGDEVENAPGSNRFNMLAGRLTGFANIQQTGMPGSETSSVYLRGIHSFQRNDITYIVDGFQTTDVRMLDPFDIEQITVLKDAAATAMYGLKSTNGLVLITTKKGKTGKLKLNYNTSTSFQAPTRLPRFLSSFDYASLYNEATLNDNPNASVPYSPEDLEGYKTNKSPYEYPNVDWVNMLLNDYSLLTRHNLSLSGGSETVRYYLSGSYFHNNGVFNVNKNVNTYNTNSEVNVFNMHGNVDVNVNKYLSIEVDIKSKKDNRNMPGNFSSTFDANLLSSIYGTPSNAYQPLTYEGKISGHANYSVNPYAELNYRGYSLLETNYISSTVQVRYKLDKLLQGLSVFGNIGFNSYSQIYTNRTKSYATHRMNSSFTGWQISGNDTEISTTGGYNSMHRDFSQLIGIDYIKQVEKNNFNALLLVDRQQNKEYIYTSLTDNYQGIKGRFNYSYDEKYLFNLSFAYSGSNRFPTYKRYGLFPALSAGWIISEEDFFNKGENNTFLKVRASYGKTGNTINPYYEYLPAFGNASGAYFGTTPTQSSGISEARIVNTSITWESALKSNLGVDFSFLKNRLNGSVDVFNEDNKNILVKNAVSVMYGDDFYNPVGKMNNKGFEFELGWNDKINDFNYFISFNYSQAKNTIVFQDEELRAYSWMYETGNPYGTRFGYVFDRYFVEDDDFATLPDQSFLGTVQPGDLKYKDLNNDNVIDENDVTVIGKPMIPEITYGMNVGFAWKNLDFSAFFQGVANLDTYNSGGIFWAFYGGAGNATYEHLGRWTPGSGQNASYPRLSLNTTNNYVTSSYWVKDASFLRLKQLEIGYNLNNAFLRKQGITKTRFFVNGYNLLTWSAIKAYDPESTVTRYPNVRSISVGLNLSF